MAWKKDPRYRHNVRDVSDQRFFSQSRSRERKKIETQWIIRPGRSHVFIRKVCFHIKHTRTLKDLLLALVVQLLLGLGAVEEVVKRTAQVAGDQTAGLVEVAATDAHGATAIHPILLVDEVMGRNAVGLVAEVRDVNLGVDLRGRVLHHQPPLVVKDGDVVREEFARIVGGADLDVAARRLGAGETRSPPGSDQLTGLIQLRVGFADLAGRLKTSEQHLQLGVAVLQTHKLV